MASPSPIVVSDELTVKIGGRKVPLTPSAAFTLAEQLIRGATRAIMIEEADRAAVLNAVRGSGV
jgi:hypothetical protein